MDAVQIHPRGLSVRKRARVLALRLSQKPPLPWKRIAKKGKNAQGHHPYWKVCRDACRSLLKCQSVSKYAHNNCGRKEVLTAEVRKWMVRRLGRLRRRREVTSEDLQIELAREKNTQVDDSPVRKALKEEGNRYLPRAEKPNYDKHQRERSVASSLLVQTWYTFLWTAWFSRFRQRILRLAKIIAKLIFRGFGAVPMNTTCQSLQDTIATRSKCLTNERYHSGEALA